MGTTYVAEFPGFFTIKIRGLYLLELLGDYFTSRMPERLAAFIKAYLAENPRFYQGESPRADLPIESVRRYFIERLNQQQQRINRLPLSPKTIKKLRNSRRTFLVENTFDALRALIGSDDRRIRRVFNVRLVDAGMGRSKKLFVSLNTMYLLRLLAGREFMIGYNIEQDPEMGFRNKKKVYGLFLNILLGYKTFVAQVMGRTPDPRHIRPGLPHGYFPPIEMELEGLEIAAEADLLRHIRDRHAAITSQISSFIIEDINNLLGELP